MNRKWLGWIVENGSYKIVALFVTIILWITILGRRDIILTREMELEVMVPAPYVAQTSTDHVQVKVAGPGTELKKFSQGPGQIVLDLGKVAEGKKFVNIPPESVDVPFGVKLLSIKPNHIWVHVTSADTGKDGKKQK